MSQLRRRFDDHEHGHDDAEKAVDAAVRDLEARGLLKDRARLQAHVRRRPERDEHGDQADEAPDQAAEETADAVRDQQHDRKQIDPRQLVLPPGGTPKRAADASRFTRGTWRRVFSPVPA